MKGPLCGALQVAFLAAKYWNGIWQQQDLARTDFESWDNAATSLQQALALARARQDFISEALVVNQHGTTVGVNRKEHP